MKVKLCLPVNPRYLPVEALQPCPVEKKPRAGPGKKERISSPTKAGKTMEELEEVARESRVRASPLKLFPH